MVSEAFGGIIALGVFFAMWVVVPSLIHKHHRGKGSEPADE